MVTARRDGHTTTRNSRFFKLYRELTDEDENPGKSAARRGSANDKSCPGECRATTTTTTNATISANIATSSANIATSISTATTIATTAATRAQRTQEVGEGTDPDRTVEQRTA